MSTEIELFKNPGTPVVWQEAPSGLENITVKDLGIPVLSIIQNKSRFIDRGHLKYTPVEGAREGSIILSPANIVFNDGIFVIPFGYKKTWVEMQPRKSGGGFVATHNQMPSDARVVTEGEKRVTRNAAGNEIVETANWGALAKVAGEWQTCIIRMSGSGLSVARQWLNRIVAVNRSRMYSHAYRLTTLPTRNQMGSFYVWNVEAVSKVTDQAVANEAVEQASLFVKMSDIEAGQPGEEPAF